MATSLHIFVFDEQKREEIDRTYEKLGKRCNINIRKIWLNFLDAKLNELGKKGYLSSVCLVGFKMREMSSVVIKIIFFYINESFELGN